MSDQTIHVIFKDQGSQTLDVDIGALTTGEQALSSLVQNNFIPAEPPGGGSWVLKHKRSGTNLAHSQTFRDAGVRDGDLVALVGAALGGAPSIEDRRSRKGLDMRLLRGTKGSGIAEVLACASVADARRGRAVSEDAALAGHFDAVLVTLTSPMLKAPGERLEMATFLFDVSSPDYPFQKPTVHVVSGEAPFCIHISPQTFFVCLGPAWDESCGKMCLVDQVIDVARYTNFDEDLAGFDGLNYDAWTYWNEELGRKPLDPSFAYPVPPYDLLGGVPEAAAVFQPRPRDLPAAKPQAAAPVLFSPRPKAAAPVFRVAPRGTP